MIEKAIDFYNACKSGDLTTVKQLLDELSHEELNLQHPPKQSTGLHVASFHGHREVIVLLLSSNKIDQSIMNVFNCTACDEAPEELKELFTTDNEIEWIDVYDHAYRLAYENHAHIKRWLTKVPLHRLLNEVTAYVDSIETFTNESDRDIIKNYAKEALKDPKVLATAYSEETPFYKALNRDLSKLGSDFRFQSTLAALYGKYYDYEAPQGLGHYVFTSILINHTALKPYYTYRGPIYRGMNITERDLDRYQENKGMITRSFLSASKNPEVAKTFCKSIRYGPVPSGVDENTRRIIRFPALCTYNIKGSSVGLDIKALSKFPHEDEVLIVPFTAFRVTNINRVFDDDHHIQSVEIIFDEGDSTLRN